MRKLTLALLAALIVLPGQQAVLSAAEIAIIGPQNWDAVVPQGKEVDAIYGDYVLRNDKLVAVIAQPIPTRNANMSIRNVGGCLIDFTPAEQQNDQLGAWYPLGKAVHWRLRLTHPSVREPGASAHDGLVSIGVAATLDDDKLTAGIIYSLEDGANFVNVQTKLTNSGSKPIEYTVSDELRTDGTVYIKGTSGDLRWAYDRWWNAAYGVVTDFYNSLIEPPPKSLPSGGKLTIRPGESMIIVRRLYVVRDLNQLQQLAGVTAAEPAQLCTIKVVDTADRPIADAFVELSDGRKLVAAGKSAADGTFAAALPAGTKTIVGSVLSAAHGDQKIDTAPGQAVTVKLPASGTVAAVITDRSGGAIPCKVQFRGVEPTDDPYFFEKSGEHAIGNLYYSHNGKFQLDLPPGKYHCTVSHGPEYDIVEQPIEILSGSQTQLNATLVRSVNTAGWVSGDFHNHASPSGDNVSSQYGRVLNLLCEHVEFAPCTEHNRISSYVPHLKRMGVEHLMGTCTGIELTSSPLPLGHLNSFPLHMHEHAQDNGAPLPDGDLEAQAARLALWDDRSDKLVQQNHPDIGWLMFDKNGDGTPDGGYAGVLPHLDVIEVNTPHNIFNKPMVSSEKNGVQNNTIFNWLQLLNQGVRLPGVVNTDAHYNIHGSGWMRNWIACPTDDPAKIRVLDIVHAAEHGHIVMSTGPFLEVSVQAAAAGQHSRGIPGDDVSAPGGKATLSVRVQCPNWFDVDRVQVFINGRPEAKLNFTRTEQPDAFTGGSVKFDRQVPLELATDAHVVVATIGEHSRLGHVMGPDHEKTRPAAVSNPIYVDVDGNGFVPNKDTLGAPLPVKSSKAK